MASNVFIEMKNINKHFGGIYALHNVRISVRQGSIHALVGENGAGKSTLMKILTGIVKKDQGEILLDGNHTDIRNLAHSQELGISFVPQELALVDYFTVAENIFLGREPRKKGGLLINWRKMYKDADILLKDLSINLNPKTKVKDLSVSDQQMLVIAKKLSQNAKVIILDEPTARLGYHEIERLLDYLKFLKSKGKSIIYITHRLEEVFKICDRITVLRDGNVVGDKDTSEITEKELIQLMVKRDVSNKIKLRKNENIGDEVLRIENLSKTGVVKNVSFSLRNGEILGFFGIVGSGRTEMMRALLGIDKKDSGTVYLDKKKVSFKHITDSLKSGLVLVPEERRQQGLVLSLSIRQNVTLGNLKEFSRFGLINAKKEKDSVVELVDKLGVKRRSLDQKASDLSGGNQQKVVLSKFLGRYIKVFILDEPTRGIDVGAKSEIYTHIKDIAKKGIPIIIISSEIPELQKICDRIIVMKQGKIVSELEQSEFIEAENIIKYAIGG